MCLRKMVPMVKCRRCLIYLANVCITIVFIYLLYAGSADRVPHTDADSTGEPTFDTTTKLMPRDFVPPNKTFTQMTSRERAAFVRQRCTETNNWKNFTSLKHSKLVSSLLTDDKYNVSLCFNRKVASTNIKRVFYTLLHDDVVSDVNTIPKGAARHVYELVDTAVDDITASGNIKVTFVRDPLERLLSAYRDKRGFLELRTHSDLTFKEFLQAVAMTPQDWENIHMTSFFDNCLPCDVDYDLIGVLDTFDADMKDVLRKIHTGPFELPQREKTNYAESSREEMSEYLHDVSPRLLDFIWNKYRLDYYIFGFDHPATWLPKNA